MNRNVIKKVISLSVNDIFSSVDSEAKSYFLGYVINLIRYNTLTTGVYSTGDSIVIDFDIVPVFNPSIKSFIDETFDCNPGHYSVVELNNIQCIKDFFSTDSFDSWVFPNLSQDLIEHFNRGIIESGLRKEFSLTRNEEPVIKIQLSSSMCPEFLACIKEPGSVKILSSGEKVISYKGINAIDFLFDLYKTANIYNIFLYDLYTALGRFSAGCTTSSECESLQFQYEKTCPEAVAPNKTRASDSGYDLTAIKVAKKVTEGVIGGVTLYDTGIKVRPPYGWYFDLVPRSSIIKSGYMLANNVGIIDSGFTGNIMIALVKVNPEAPDLELPIRIAQLIPRRIVNMEAIEVESLDKSERGENGFGSSGK
jgi:deoxyuridine 5'-triphosphate nucleotidohydrolase